MNDASRAPLFLPKLVTVLRAGYGARDLRRDALAGLTVAIVALPLAMALAIASGTTPDKGLITAVVAGFLISALGGSRFQIGGPTGAFIPVVFAVIAQHGYDGLVLATLMASVMLMLAGLLRLGALLRYMPQPLITGFTAGIAVIIFSSQLKDLFGLPVAQLPVEFVPKLMVLAEHLGEFNPWALGLALGCVALIVGLRRVAPTAPGFLVVVVVASIVVAAFDLPVETIGSRFGEIPAALPTPAWPDVSWARMVQLLPSAFTIAFLAGVESLLSAVVADGMTSGRHRSNTELIAQGIANAGSALVGGLPATGAIARTATNIRAGGRTPISGMLHAVFILIFMLLLAGWMRYVPLPALAGVLVVVAWNMSEHRHFLHTLSAPRGDRVLLLLTFGLTVFVDLTVAIEVGMVLAAFVFMHRMASAVEIGAGVRILDDDLFDARSEALSSQRDVLPPGVEVFQVSGPLFFAISDRLDEVLDQFFRPPYVFILRMRLVPFVDASGVHALNKLAERCRRQKTVLILSGLQSQPRKVLERMGMRPDGKWLHFAAGFDAACDLAATLSARGIAPDGSGKIGV